MKISLSNSVQKIILTIFVLLLLAVSCKKEEKKETTKEELNLRYTKIVIADPSIFLREKPSTESIWLCTIPYLEQVGIYNEIPEELEIKGIKGKWVYVKYKENFGWCFDGYLIYEDLCNENMELTLSDYEITEYKKIKINMSIPHGSCLVVIAPDNKQYYLISPFGNRAFYGDDTINFDNFYKVKEIEIDTKDIMSISSTNENEEERVFNQNGIYRINVASKWNTGGATYKEVQLTMNIK